MDATSGPAADRSPRHRSLRLLAPGLAVLVLVTAGCSSRGSSDAPTASAGAAHPDSTGSLDARSPAASQAAAQAATQAIPAVQQRAVISTGQVTLTSGDVGRARTRVDEVVTREGGRIADENTTTNRHGTVTSSHLVVRVPSARFDEAMQALEGVATLRSSSRKAQDVTTEVIDLQARVAAQRAGVQRLRQLVSGTGNLRALLAVERALTDRQGELESLQRQQAYLADQTSLATITVDITPRTTPPPPVTHTGGFVGGLQQGWSALTAMVNGALLGLGRVSLLTKPEGDRAQDDASSVNSGELVVAGGQTT
ncbi:MAG: DUF4349 domain-containing protein, partial [Nocardioides sp.]|nr:DUF4349 domain-containing protein [Nocardioides sp.]